MKMRYPLFFFLVCSLTWLHGNSDVRTWTLSDGSRLRAELVDYDTESGGVLLKVDDKEDKILAFKEFSPIDRAWLVEWDEFGEE